MGYNFFVDSLGFNKAVSPDNPYQRATAPFRKDQIDSAPTVGDQSLTGWWTRGQLSFHKGEGFEFYDTLGTEAVLNTCYTSNAADLFSTPGRVIGDPKMSQWFTMPANTTCDNIIGLTMRAHQGSTGLIYKISGTPAAGATLTQIPLASSGYSATALAQGKDYQWVAGYNWGTGAGELERLNGSTLTAVYSHTTYIDMVGYGKGRLWVMDSDGGVYTAVESPTGTLPVSLGSAVMTIDGAGDNSADPAFADGPSAVYMSRRGEDIYAITLSSDGSVPTLAAPVVVATMPQGEIVRGLLSTLGRLVILTSLGVRIADIGSDGSVTYGPLVIKMTGGSNLGRPYMGVRGTKVRLVHCYAGEAVLWEIDLASPSDTGPLIYPYRAAWHSGEAYSAANNGMAEWGDARIFWNGSNVYTDYGHLYNEDATITTGYHRMGTLDPKRFIQVEVYADGDSAGSIKVYRVDADGTETYLGSLTCSDGKGVFPLNMSTAVERVALKFVATTLEQNPVSPPTLLGYQLKPLPVPKRQRLIRVPVFMFDVEQDSGGHRMGRAKDAWTRLQALEAYEEANSIVTYRDEDTGETGTAYIESVETQVESTSSARASDRGFGGIVTITLRRIGD